MINQTNLIYLYPVIAFISALLSIFIFIRFKKLQTEKDKEFAGFILETVPEIDRIFSLVKKDALDKQSILEIQSKLLFFLNSLTNPESYFHNRSLQKDFNNMVKIAQTFTNEFRAFGPFIKVPQSFLSKNAPSTKQFENIFPTLTQQDIQTAKTLVNQFQKAYSSLIKTSTKL
ncbi:MAG: hypothetical protein CVU39_06270 [Chloroflexi bacterium HGW-Chloroflexi-10]|nr:MAG: hypothetical protein CVU39_06270 [Chloroflexi bacterium HGW-Chloroflexi-10]